MSNRRILILLLVLFGLALISALGSILYNEYFLKNAWYLKFDSQNLHNKNGGWRTKANGFFWDFVTFCLLYNNLVPVSLQVTLEMVRFFQASYIDQVLLYFFKFFCKKIRIF
jgi:phospholipid-transporting ATPase